MFLFSIQTFSASIPVVNYLKNHLWLIWTFLTFLGLAFILYGATLAYPFISLDDPYLIYNNLMIRGPTLANIQAAFTRYDPELYIPLTFISFQFNYLMSGLDPWSYHLTNLVLHAANALLVTLVTDKLLKKRWMALLCGLVFLVHPLNAEVVIWATSRKEALSVFFALLSIVFYLRHRSQKKYAYIVSILLFLCALLSKVTVLTLPILLLLIDWLMQRKWDRKILTDKIPFFVFSLVLGLVGLLPKEKIFSSTTLWQKILMAGKSTIFYIWKFLWPSDLSVLYPAKTAIALTSPDFLVSFVLFGALVVATIWLIWKNRVMAFGFMFFLLTLSPTYIHFNRAATIASNGVSGIQFASDHYVYLPMIGIVIVLAALLELLIAHIRETRSASMNEFFVSLGAAVALIALATATVFQSHHWRTSEDLFEHTLAAYPWSAAARINLSVIYRNTDRASDERKVLEDGLMYGPNSRLSTGLGAIAARNGEYARAEERFREAMEVEPTNPQPHFSRGAMLADQQKVTEALKEYDRALALDAGYVAVYNNIGSLMLAQGNRAEVEQNFLKAVSINPTFVAGFYNLGLLYGADKKFPQAIEQFTQVVTIDPKSIEARVELVPLYLQNKQPAEALRMIKEILAIDPKNEAALSLLAEMRRLGIVGNATN